MASLSLLVTRNRLWFFEWKQGAGRNSSFDRRIHWLAQIGQDCTQNCNLDHSVCVICFSVGLLVINYSYVQFSSAREAGAELAWVVPAYWLGGPVAFDQVANDPGSVPSTQPINSFFVETANSLGAHFEELSPHAQFTTISSATENADANVYTIYFSYYKDYGWFGMIGLMMLAGFCLTILYHVALRMGPVSLVICAMTLVGTVFSFNAEHYWRGLNEYIKAAVFFSVLYYGPALRLRRRSKAALSRIQLNSGLPRTLAVSR